MSTDGTFETLSANGSGKVMTVYGRMHLHLSGDFGGGTVQLKLIDSNGTTRDVAGASYTAAVDAIFDWPARAGTEVYVELSGATTPTLVYGIRGENR